jgi:hypothetical protein
LADDDISRHNNNQATALFAVFCEALMTMSGGQSQGALPENRLVRVVSTPTAGADPKPFTSPFQQFFWLKRRVAMRLAKA